MVSLILAGRQLNKLTQKWPYHICSRLWTNQDFGRNEVNFHQLFHDVITFECLRRCLNNWLDRVMVSNCAAFYVKEFSKVHRFPVAAIPNLVRIVKIRRSWMISAGLGTIF